VAWFEAQEQGPGVAAGDAAGPRAGVGHERLDIGVLAHDLGEALLQAFHGLEGNALGRFGRP